MFRLYFMHSNFTDVRTVKEAGAHLQYKLEGLGNKISFILLVLVNNLNLGGREEDQTCMLWLMVFVDKCSMIFRI